MRKGPVIIKGAGEMASGTAHKLFRAGLKVVMTEIPQPQAVRRGVSFAQAVFTGEHTVEDVTACCVQKISEIIEVLNQGFIPVLPRPLTAEELEELNPRALVDATLAKEQTDTYWGEAPVVIGLGPGFRAPEDVHAVIETQRGHHLGRIYFQGIAAPNTGEPGEILGYTWERVLRSPAKGEFVAFREIGDEVEAGDEIGVIDKQDMVCAGIPGVIRGLIYPGLTVGKGTKLGDIDPRGIREYCFTISDKARNIAGGVLEALLFLEGKKYV